MKRILWRVVKRLSYIEEARCLKVKKQKQVKNKHSAMVGRSERTARKSTL